MNLDSKGGVRAAYVLAGLVVFGGVWVVVELVRHVL
jgi:hypothetical protein